MLKNKEVEKEKLEKTEYRFTYKDIFCEIVFWTTEYMKNNSSLFKNGGIWNSYFLVRKDSKYFKDFNLRAKKVKLSIGYDFDYEKLPIKMSGGTTYYEKLRNGVGEIMMIKIGNDYNHIWNGGETLESIESDLKETIDSFLAQYK